RDIHKTALGATETVDWFYFENTKEAVFALKEKGYCLFAVEQTTTSISLEKFNASNYKKLAVVFGNEVEGVDGEVIKLCEGCIEIPQEGMKHSLNISVAAGIVLWKLFESKL
ncbi:MAG: TrmH family RNA methyltransferase, partial [Bacteroidetes bacterium]|nr:TrmH family RNA methyltransferase [Bacteroidota bacterium]